MDIQEITKDNKYSVRTQISLSKTLYKLVRNKAKKENKSISQITREALITDLHKSRLTREEETEKLKALAKKMRGMVKPGDGGWGDVKDPHKLIRSWRSEEDRYSTRLRKLWKR